MDKNDKDARAGRPANPNKKISKTRVSLRPDMWALIEAYAETHNLSVNAAVEALIEKGLNEKLPMWLAPLVQSLLEEGRNIIICTIDNSIKRRVEELLDAVAEDLYFSDEIVQNLNAGRRILIVNPKKISVGYDFKDLFDTIVWADPMSEYDSRYFNATTMINQVNARINRPNRSRKFTVQSITYYSGIVTDSYGRIPSIPDEI